MNHRRYPRAPGPWRPQGAPYYLEDAGERLSLPPLLTDHPRVKDNRQLMKISGLTAQVCTSYFGAPRHGDDRRFTDQQLAAARAVLAQCEPEVAKTHAIAAAAAEMVDEAYVAFGLAPPARNFSVVIAAETAARSVEVASLRAEVQRLAAENPALRTEVERLRAENASLARQVDQLTEPPVAPDRPSPSPPKPAPHRPHQPKS